MGISSIETIRRSKISWRWKVFEVSTSRWLNAFLGLGFCVLNILSIISDCFYVRKQHKHNQKQKLSNCKQLVNFYKNSHLAIGNLAKFVLWSVLSFNVSGMSSPNRKNWQNLEVRNLQYYVSFVCFQAAVSTLLAVSVFCVEKKIK